MKTRLSRFQSVDQVPNLFLISDSFFIQRFLDALNSEYLHIYIIGSTLLLAVRNCLRSDSSPPHFPRSSSFWVFLGEA